MSADKVDRNELQRVNSYQWPSGHVGHLTEGQRGALEKFKLLCQEKGYYNPGDDKTAASHDEETLLRYLRARKFIPQDAFGQFKDTEDWREENKIDHLYETIDIQEYDRARVLYPQWTGRRDKRGIPFYVFQVGDLKAKDVAAYQNDKDRKANKPKGTEKSKVPRKMLTLFALYEHLCRFVLPLCAAIPDRPNHETPVSQSNNIVDISNVSLRQFWNLRAHMQDASNLATAHYPETLDRIFIVGAPVFFPTVWEWVKAWFDPITVSKIFILKNANMKSTLEKYIDLDDLPKKYGGNLDWEFGDLPMLEPAIANSLRWKGDIRHKGHRTLPIGPIKWQYDEDGDLVAVAIGSQDGKPRHQVLAGLHPEAGVTRLALSPGRAAHPANSTIAQVASAPNNFNQNSKTDAASSSNTTTSPAPNGQAFPPQPANGHPVPASNTTMSAPPAEDLPTSSTTPAALAAQGSGRDDSPSQTEAYSVPYRDHDNDIHQPPIDGRQGTSASRYTQQASTHAHGIVGHGTPETKVDGQGVEHAVMEPRTVGQAPKETNLYREEGEQPGILAQVQDTAGKVVGQVTGLAGGVLGAVGLGGKEEVKQEETTKGDERVDGVEPKIVEEFLREKNMSKAEDQKTE